MGDGVAATAVLGLLVSGIIFYVVVKPILVWLKSQGGHKLTSFMAQRAHQKGHRVHQKGHRARRKLKGFKMTNAIVLRASAIIVVAMLIYMPAASDAGRVFEYRFIWDMGKDGYEMFSPRPWVLVAQILGVSVVATLLAASNGSGR